MARMPCSGIAARSGNAIRQTVQRIVCMTAAVYASLLGLTARAAAQTNGGSSGNLSVITVPSCLDPSWMRLFAFVDNLIVVSVIFGTLIAVLSIVIGGVAMMGVLGKQWRQWGRRVIKWSIIGLVVLYSADIVVGYLFTQLAPSLC